MRNILTFLVLSLLVLPLRAQQPQLKFNKDGEFKIVQFTDVHFKSNNPASVVALKRMNEVLDTEKPDLVIYTGDIVYAAPADSALMTVLDCVVSRNIPFVITFGNHDDELDKSRSELYDIARKMPYNCMPDRGDACSPDYVLPIKCRDGKQNAALLYCLDSHSYSKLEGVKGYGWFTNEQVAWFKNQSLQYTASNGGKPFPALAFFHIPLPEYLQAACDEHACLIGTRMEKVCSPELNTGMFTAMREAGDVMATFVGHDHDNDYAVMWHGILLAYGRFTGGNTEYNHLPNGARVILLKEGKRSFDSWIRIKGGQLINPITYPDSFVKDDWRNRPLEME